MVDYDPYNELSNAIILQAVYDYRKLNRIPSGDERYEWAQKEVKQIERFFLSRWFALLTTIEGEILLEQLQKEVKDDDRQGIPGKRGETKTQN